MEYGAHKEYKSLKGVIHTFTMGTNMTIGSYVSRYTLSIFRRNTPTFMEPPDRKLWLHHTRGQRKYTSKLQHLTWDFDLLLDWETWKRLRPLHPHPAAIKEY